MGRLRPQYHKYYHLLEYGWFRSAGVNFYQGGTGNGVRFVNSTIAFNELTSGSNGGGIYISGDQNKFRLDNSIVANNLALGSANDIVGLISRQ